MTKLSYEINAGLGDNLIIRSFFDPIKHNYEQIKISHNKTVISTWRNGDPAYYNFLNKLGILLFSEPPYVYDEGHHLTPIEMPRVIKDLKLVPRKPDVDGALCRGSSLNLGEEYIVITTKIRLISKQTFFPLSTRLWKTLKNVSKKYKFVILGERDVEKSKEYLHGDNPDLVYGIYEQIVSNIPNDRILDLTVPALGITAPDIQKIQQDCLIMKEAKAVITLGIGGNFWLSLCVANTIGFRCEPIHSSPALREFYGITDSVNNPHFTSAFITKDWNDFLQKLEAL